MGKPLFKASEGGQYEGLKELEDSIFGVLRQGMGTKVLIGSKVRLEAFPNGLPMPV